MMRCLPLILAAALGAGCAGTDETSAAMGEARTAYDGGQYEECVKQCSAVLMRDPLHADALFLRGRALEQLGEHAKAAGDFERVRTGDPSRGEAAVREARCYLALGQQERARTTLENVKVTSYNVISARDQMFVHAVLGEVHLAGGSPAPAVDELEAAARIVRSSNPLGSDPASALVSYNLSRAYFERGAYPKSREAYQGYLRDLRATGGPGPDDLYTLAVLHFLCGDLKATREVSAKLPAEQQTKVDAVLKGDALSVRALYDQHLKEAGGTENK